MMMNSKGCAVHSASYWLLWIACINWGLVGIGGFLGQNWNVINLLLGRWPQVEWILYVLVGIATICMLAKNNCKMCKLEAGKRV